MTGPVEQSFQPMDRGKLADAILTSALDCIIVSDAQGRIIEFNPAAERTFGLSRAQVVGRLMEDTIVPHKHRAAHRNGMARFLAGGKASVVGRRIEIEALHADGHVFPVELSITDTEMDGQVYFVANLRDISDLKRTASELRQAQASLEAIFNNIPAALYLRDLNDHLVMINSWGANFLGRSAEEMIGHDMKNFREPQNMEGVREVDAAILQDRKPITRPFTYHLPGGDRVGLMTFFPVLDAEGQVVQIGGMMIDATELYAARSELQEARHLLQSIFDSVPAVLYLRELDGRIITMNRFGAAVIGGDDPASMVGTLMQSYDSEAQSRKAAELQARLLTTGNPETMEYRRMVDGREVVVLNSIFPVRDAEGKIVRIGGFASDVTELYAARAELQRARSLLQAFFDHVPAGVFINQIGPGGLDDQTCEFANDRMGAPFGLKGRQIIGTRPFDQFADAAWRDDLLRRDTDMARDGQPAYFEMANAVTGRIEGHTRFPIFDEAGNLTHIGGVTVDVEDTVRAKQQLLEAQQLLQTIFDNVPAELYLRRLDGHYLMANKWSLDFYGVTEADLPYLTAESFDAEEIDKSRQAQAELLATGRPVTREYRQKARGREVVILNTIFPMRNAEGQIDRIGGVSTDITELYDARNALRQAQENLHQSEKLAALGQLLAGVAHELNNPLAVVLGRAAILQEKLAGTPHEPPLQKLREAANRCARIVKTFLAMARQTGPRRAQSDVNELVESALEMTTYSLRNSNISWSVTALAEPLKIEVDEDQIVQVLINLILNAQQALATLDGERRLDIQAFLCPSGEWVHLTVSDNGPGVPDAIASRIFDPFFTTKAVGEGTGLGLSVCKSMVEAHGGKLVHFKSDGGGASFRISLPVGGGRDASAGQEGEGVSTSRIIGRMLIVDDEVEIAAILADCLTPLGIDCIIASDGQAALDRLAETAFDGIFCDVSMPGMDGITFYNRLKETNPLLARHLIFISGDVLHREWDRLKSSVDRPVIEKPFDPRHVRDAAMSLLAKDGVPR